MSSRSVGLVVGMVLVLTMVLAALPSATATSAWVRSVEGTSVEIQEQCEPQPGPISQAAEWARCQTVVVVDAAREYACRYAGC